MTERAPVDKGTLGRLVMTSSMLRFSRDRLSKFQLEDPIHVGFAPLFQSPGNKLSDAEV